MKNLQILAMLIAAAIMTVIYFGIITLATAIAGIKVLASLRWSGALLTMWADAWDYFNKHKGE